MIEASIDNFCEGSKLFKREMKRLMKDQIQRNKLNKFGGCSQVLGSKI